MPENSESKLSDESTDASESSNVSPEEAFELQKKNCIFCKIAAKDIPSKVLHETDNIICVLDINPASEGHILVFPKEHYMIMPHVPEDLQAELFKSAKLMSNTLLTTLQARGTTIFVANGAAAGQRAPHVLVHVFPRKENDGLLTLPKAEINNEQTAKLKSELSPVMKRLFGKGNNDNAIAEISKEKIIRKPASKDIHTPEKHSVKHEKSDAKAAKINLDDVSKLFGG